MSIRERMVRERVAVTFGATSPVRMKGEVSLMLTVPSGTPVLLQKQQGSIAQYKNYVTQQEIAVKRPLKDTQKAMLIFYCGYKIWVAKKFVVWREILLAQVSE